MTLSTENTCALNEVLVSLQLRGRELSWYCRLLQVEPVDESTVPNTAKDGSLGVSLALTAVALVVIGGYDWRLAATTLAVVVALAALRRIFGLIMHAEEAHHEKDE
jgi:hypothetical protein